MYKLIIYVTQDVLNESANCEGGLSIGRHCAIAVAVRDIFPKAFVENEDIWVYGQRKNSTTFIKLPKEARKFIRMFDRRTPRKRKNMTPISFEIQIPDNVIKKINISELTSLLKNHATLELV